MSASFGAQVPDLAAQSQPFGGLFFDNSNNMKGNNNDVNNSINNTHVLGGRTSSSSQMSLPSASSSSSSSSLVETGSSSPGFRTQASQPHHHSTAITNSLHHTHTNGQPSPFVPPPPPAPVHAPSPPPPLRSNHDSFLDLDKALNYEVRVVTGNANRPLAQEIAHHLRLRITSADVTTFSDGEIRVSIGENVRGKDVFLIQSTSPPVNDHLMELLVIIDTLKRASAKRITAVMPYYGYARQDRKSAPRVPITARLVADLITTAGADRVLAFELHAGQIQGFFNIPVDHVFAMPVFEQYIRTLDDPVDNPVIVSPDAGGVDRARALARRLDDAGLAIIDKRRSAPNVAHVMHVVGDVKDRDCIIVDDMVDTAGTLTQAANALKESGARRVKACCIHAVLSGPAIARIQESCIEELIITNSILQPEHKKIPKITCLSVGPLMAETISRVHREESVSTLFGD